VINRLTRSRKLFVAVLLFILLDLLVLLINYWIAYQVSSDAIAINLSGRQRMLTQRMTKTLLQLRQPDPATEAASAEEFRSALQMFDQTLRAFESGGQAVGGDGKPVYLRRVGGDESRALIRQANLLWQPVRDRVAPYVARRLPLDDEAVAFARNQMLQHNLQLLDLMNRLAFHLEKDSRERANLLRLIQTLVFVLALVNFVVIVRGFHLLARQAEEASERFGELAARDELTGLFNRRQFNQALEREIAVAQRRQSGFALLLLDLDGFKPVNDRHGHVAGDIVLRTVAARLAIHARSNDTVARIGGDEFVLICPDLCDEQAAAALCERLLRAMNEPVVIEDGSVHIGASIGIAFFPRHAGTLDALVHAADSAMYAAKHAGRNRWLIAGNERS
jgi:diguanylate cyclase (GGDEF)-like protein